MAPTSRQRLESAFAEYQYPPPTVEEVAVRIPDRNVKTRRPGTRKPTVPLTVIRVSSVGLDLSGRERLLGAHFDAQGRFVYVEGRTYVDQNEVRLIHPTTLTDLLGQVRVYAPVANRSALIEAAVEIERRRQLDVDSAKRVLTQAQNDLYTSLVIDGISSDVAIGIVNSVQTNDNFERLIQAAHRVRKVAAS